MGMDSYLKYLSTNPKESKIEFSGIFVMRLYKEKQRKEGTQTSPETIV
jgi:hypothetical protein